MDNKKNFQKLKKPKNLWIILTIIVFLLGFLFAAHAFRSLMRHGFFGPPHYKAISVDGIKGWMTFDFVNKSFHLPPDYLKKELDITDKKYPNVTIDHGAKNIKENPSILVEEIKNLIRNYQNPPLPEAPISI
jgi:hypothetical protein